MEKSCFRNIPCYDNPQYWTHSRNKIHGLEVLANLIENHTDVKILEHTLRALAEITYPFPSKVGNLYIEPNQIQPLLFRIAANNHATLSTKLDAIINDKSNKKCFGMHNSSSTYLSISTSYI